jgi:CubicO group peptidase (beta-lactamase class C family)
LPAPERVVRPSRRRLRGLAVAVLALLPACGEAAPIVRCPEAAPQPAVTAPPKVPVVAPRDPRSVAVDALFAPWTTPGSPGCAVAVVSAGQVVHASGYGLADVEHDAPITPDTVFHSASLAKQFTAYAAHLLAARGRLGLDDDVRRYVPELPDYGHPITIRHLLHHTSGLRDQWNLLHLAGFRGDDVITAADALAMAARQKALNFPPGTQHLYSNTGYTILALAIERITGQTLRAFVEAEIFGPLAMRRSEMHDDHTRPVPGRASAYAPRKGGGLSIAVPAFDLVGPTSLFTTARDLALWDANFDSGAAGGRGVVDALLERGTTVGGVVLRYGSGLEHGEYRGLPTIEHGGADGGFRAYYLRIPAPRLSVIALCNLATIPARDLATRVADVYLGADVAKAPATATLTADDVAGAAGTYFDPSHPGVLRFEAAGAELRLVGSKEPLFAVDRAHFRVGRLLDLQFAAGTLDATSPVDGFARRYLQVPALKLTPTELAAFAGTYASADLGVDFTLAVKDAGLVVRPPRTDERLVLPLVADGFAGELGVLRFTRNARRAISGFTLSTSRTLSLPFTRVDRKKSP